MITFLVQNWDTIMTLLNAVGLVLVTKHKVK